ncbi:MAG: hypothetical protein LC623_00315, partial [Halobacteriales archaeon]|nr:hypothetical protein [Halobacteriales archaeon]
MMGFFSRKPKVRKVRFRTNYRSLPQEEWTEDEFDHWFDGLGEREQWAEWERWSRETYDHPTIKAVRRSVLDLAAEASR